MVNGISAEGADAFRIYAPSHSNKSLTIVSAEPTEIGLTSKMEKKVELGFHDTVIVAHPKEPLLYIAPVREFKAIEHPGALVTLEKWGAEVKFVSRPRLFQRTG